MSGSLIRSSGVPEEGCIIACPWFRLHSLIASDSGLNVSTNVDTDVDDIKHSLVDRASLTVDLLDLLFPAAVGMMIAVSLPEFQR